jgi:hypothetical protein
MLAAAWPFETFRLSLVERDVPRDDRDPAAPKDTYTTHMVARRDIGQLHMLIFWRSFAANPGCPCRSRRPETRKQHSERAEQQRSRYRPLQRREHTKGE